MHKWFPKACLALVVVGAVVHFSRDDGDDDATPVAAGLDDATPVAAGLIVCAMFESAPSVSECNLNYGDTHDNSVDVEIDMSVPEARKACQMMVGMVKDKGGKTLANANWNLRILSPFSTGLNALAICEF